MWHALKEMISVVAFRLAWSCRGRMYIQCCHMSINRVVGTLKLPTACSTTLQLWFIRVHLQRPYTDWEIYYGKKSSYKLVIVLFLAEYFIRLVNNAIRFEGYPFRWMGEHSYQRRKVHLGAMVSWRLGASSGAHLSEVKRSTMLASMFCKRNEKREE